MSSNNYYIDESYYAVVDHFNIDKSFVPRLPPGLIFEVVRFSQDGLELPGTNVVCIYSDFGTTKIVWNDKIWAKYAISVHDIYQDIIKHLKCNKTSMAFVEFYVNWNKYDLIYLLKP